MNFKLGFIIFIVGFVFITSCKKENIDTTNVEEEVVIDTVTCNLSIDIIENDSTGVLTAFVAGGTTPYNFQWSTEETTESITPSSNGTFEVSVVDAEGCTATNSIMFEESTPCDSLSVYIEVSDTTLIAIVLGGIGPYTYSWEMGGIFVTGGQSVPISSNGTYVVTVTDSQGCTVYTSTTIQDPDPCQSLNVFPTSGSLTNILTVSPVGGTPPYAYEWSTGETTQSITVSVVGFYTVIVTDSEGCESLSSFEVTDIPCIDLGISFDFDAAVSTLTANVNNGTPPYVYEWSTGETTNTIAVVSGNTYTVEITDAGGCMGEDAYTVP